MEQFNVPILQLQEIASSEASMVDSASSPPTPTSSGSDITEDLNPHTESVSKTPFLYVPDMFSSIMAVDPVVNPHYSEVKPKADDWITEYD
jgi:hypothetical protein